MAKLKLPFELEKPSPKKFVTQASEIGHGEKSVEEELEDFSQKINGTATPIAGTFVENGVIDSQGGFVENSGFSIYSYDVDEGMLLHIHTELAPNDNTTRVQAAAYNDNTFVAVISTGNIITDVDYTVPSGVNKICVYNNNTKNQSVEELSGVNVERDIPYLKEKTDALEASVSVLQEQTEGLTETTIYGNDDFYVDGGGVKSYYYALNRPVGQKVNDTPVKMEGGTWGCMKLFVKQNSTVIIKTVGGNTGRAYGITDANLYTLVVSPAGENTINNPFIYKFSADGYLYVNCTNNELAEFSVEIQTAIADKLDDISDEVSGMKLRLGISEENISNLDSEVEAIDSKLNGGIVIEPITDVSFISSVYLAKNGVGSKNVSLVQGSSSRKVKFYPCEEGKHYKISVPKTGSSSTRIVAYTNTYLDSVSEVTTTVSGLVLDNIGDDAAQLVELTSALDYPYFVVCYNPAAGEPTVTSEEVVDSYDDRLEELEESVKDVVTKKNVNPKVDLRKSELRILDIGNSFTDDAITYLPEFTTAANLNVSDIRIIRAVRGGGSYKSWYDCYHDSDTVAYGVYSTLGSLSININGTAAIGNGEKFRNTLANNKFDIIFIHQSSTYADNYDVWESNGEGGYLKELLRIIRLYQPQAAIGTYIVHSSFDLYPDIDKGLQKIMDATKKFMKEYDIDIVIPYGVAVQNIRKSILNTSTHALSRDDHHLGYGLARYVAAATYYQSVLAPRYGVSVFGSTCVHTVTDAEKALSDYRNPEDCIDVTNANKETAQMAAMLACEDMWNVNNPDGVTI